MNRSPILRLAFFFSLISQVFSQTAPIQEAAKITDELASSKPNVKVQEAAGITNELQQYNGNQNGRHGASTVLSKEDELYRLSLLPPIKLPFRGALLSKTICGICEIAGMDYVAPSETDFGERASFNIMTNPYEMLVELGETYGFGMEYGARGVWHFYKYNYNQLLSKVYTIKWNNQQSVEVNTPSLANQITSQMSSYGSGNSSKPDSQAQKESFTVTDNIIKDIELRLAIPTNTTVENADSASYLPSREASRKIENPPVVKPIFNADTGKLLVTGTREQIKNVDRYIKEVDLPQDQIRLAVKFVETARDPKKTIGVDLSNTPLNGKAISLSGGAAADTLGTGTSLQPLTTNIDLNKPRATRLPMGVLSAPDFSVALNFYMTDRKSSIISDPEYVTANNRRVTFKATVQQPIKASSTNFGTATASSTSQIAYIEVGPTLRTMAMIMPGKVNGRNVIKLNVSILVSSITGEKIIDGSSYPITPSREYEFEVYVPDGDTLCIAGLDERVRETTSGKVPIFGDIPVLGYLFKKNSDNLTVTTLLAFITPHIERIGATEGPASALVLPRVTHRLFEGSNKESLEDVRSTLKGLPTDISSHERTANEMNRDLVLNRLNQFGIELSLIELRLQELRVAEYQNVDAEVSSMARIKNLLDVSKASVSKIKN